MIVSLEEAIGSSFRVLKRKRGDRDDESDDVSDEHEDDGSSDDGSSDSADGSDSDIPRAQRMIIKAEKASRKGKKPCK